MDTGEGRFEQFSADDKLEAMREMAELRQRFPKSGGVFHVGEKLVIKGSVFKVTKIDQFGMRLRLQKKE